MPWNTVGFYKDVHLDWHGDTSVLNDSQCPDNSQMAGTLVQYFTVMCHWNLTVTLRGECTGHGARDW